MTIPAIGVNRLCAIALAAGREIMAVYEEGSLSVVAKSDGSPVTQADTRAEAVIISALRREWPDVSIIAEEEAAAGRVDCEARRFFLVDPLDGTKEFIGRNGEFTVNIALIEDGVPVMGVVHAPALNVLYGGASGRAFCAALKDGVMDNPRTIAVRCAPSSIHAVGSRSHGSDETDRWLSRFQVSAFKSRGSSLKFCLLAAGEADVYPRFGRTMEWDTAAGDAVLRAAGGIVKTLDGSPLRYNKRSQPHDVDFANPHFVAYGDPMLAARMVV